MTTPGRIVFRHCSMLVSRGLTVVLIVLSAAASVLLAAAPPPSGLTNTDPAVVKIVSVSVVAAFGAALPALAAFIKPGSRPRLVMAVFALALLANAFVLSPLVATPVQTILSSVALPVAGALVLLQTVHLEYSPHGEM